MQFKHSDLFCHRKNEPFIGFAPTNFFIHLLFTASKRIFSSLTLLTFVHTSFFRFYHLSIIAYISCIHI
ncbi:hypothetical protein CW304_07935 [Bacillus sp. UFRGS-B20]|nr:hypothetical protein CW304_07935 [Bacillus sp. UFRGS-B20]